MNTTHEAGRLTDAERANAMIAANKACGSDANSVEWKRAFAAAIESAVLARAQGEAVADRADLLELLNEYGDFMFSVGYNNVQKDVSAAADDFKRRIIAAAPGRPPLVDGWRTLFADALRKIKYEAVSLADAQVLALQALKNFDNRGRTAPTPAKEPQPVQSGASGQFRKKPVVIEAWRIDLDNPPPQWVSDALAKFEGAPGAIDWDAEGKGLWINTLEGCMTADEGDMLIKGVKGELYACKPDIFAATYEPVALPAVEAAEGRSACMGHLTECPTCKNNIAKCTLATPTPGAASDAVRERVRAALNQAWSEATESTMTPVKPLADLIVERISVALQEARKDSTNNAVWPDWVTVLKRENLQRVTVEFPEVRRRDFFSRNVTPKEWRATISGPVDPDCTIHAVVLERVALATTPSAEAVDAARWRHLVSQHEIDDDEATDNNYGRTYPKRTLCVFQDDGEDGLEPVPCDPGALAELVDAAMSSPAPATKEK